MTELILPLTDPAAMTAAQTGGKGANLARLAQSGFDVPPGFVVGTDAYREAARDLDPLVDELAATSADRSADVSFVASRIAERLRECPLPDELAAAITREARALGGPVAVRSSATAEDLPFASFAGQQDSFLGIEGDAAVLDAVRRCWASLWNERAVAYRASNGIDQRSVALAVVVQRMVEAETAGVLFTADPVTGRRGRAVVEAVRGLGDRLVSGQVDPDRYVVETRSGKVLERSERDARLDDARLRELADVGRRLERRFGAPQDAEWAVDRAGRLWLVQTRAITTLYPLPEGVDPDGPLRVWFSVNVAQGFLEPFTPAGIQTFRLFGSSVGARIGAPPRDPLAGPPFLVVAGMRLHGDLTGLLRHPLGRRVILAIAPNMEARTAAILSRVLDEPGLALGRGSRLRAARAIGVALVRMRLPLRVLGALRDPVGANAAVEREVARVLALGDVGPAATARARFDAALRLQLQGIGRVLPAAGGLGAAGMLSYGIAGRLLGADARTDELRTLLRALPTSPTSAMNLELWALAQEARADPASARALAERGAPDLAAGHHAGRLPDVLARGLTRFLGRYGHRGIGEIDVGVARWSEDPTQVLLVLQNYLRLEDPAAAPDAQFRRLAAEADAMAEELARRARRRGLPRGVAARFFLGRARRLAGYREAPKFHAVRLIARARALLASVGADLALARVIEKADDVFFLDARETGRALDGEDLHELIASRREVYERERRRRSVPRVLLSDGRDAEAAFGSPAAAGAIRGTAASAGVVTGVARVVRSPAGARLEPGEILVAPSTDPGWTPLFLTAGGLVMEMGGMMSHGAVVAREYGIPAVVGVAGATERIASGARITVDGSAGTVVVEDGAS